MQSRSLVRASTVAVIALWIAVVGMGARTLLRYANTPAPVTSPPTAWPAASKLTQAVGHPTLLVFAHPECPCTRATLGELALIVAQVRTVDANVVFSAASTISSAWNQTELWRTAVSMPQ